MEEIWKSIEGWEGIYEVSNYGRIKSLDRVVYRGHQKAKHHLKERILKHGYNYFGRPIIHLQTEEKDTTLQISRIVAKTFIANPNNYPEVNHIDGDPSNNRVDNLEWCTPSDNVKHAWDNGLKQHYTTHLTDTDVKKMRAYREFGLPLKFISEIFNCSIPTVCNICKGTHRNNVPNDLYFEIH